MTDEIAVGDGPPEGVLSMRGAALMPQEDESVLVVLVLDGVEVRQTLFQTRAEAQRLVDWWTQPGPDGTLPSVEDCQR